MSAAELLLYSIGAVGFMVGGFALGAAWRSRK